MECRTNITTKTAQLHLTGLILAFLVLFNACDSTTEQIIPNNDAYSTTGISKIKIENYVNRLFIDILGREPLDEEFIQYTDTLVENDLSKESRLRIIDKLMTDTSFSQNEGSYQEAFSNNLYLLAKIRCIEGFPDNEIQQDIGIARSAANIDSILGNWDEFYKKLNKIRRLQLVLNSKIDLREGKIRYHEMFAPMIDNDVFDFLNMNSFNFIRASFDQLLYRLPSVQEYDEAFNMVEFNQVATLFEELGSNKNDYIEIMISSEAMLEGMIRWSYKVFLLRDPSPAEASTLILEYKDHLDINQVIAAILVTDEYANFN